MDDNIETTDMYRDSESKDDSKRTIGKRFQESSPEEIKETVKATVKKGVAAVAGAVEGLADEMEADDVAGNAKRAIDDLGDATSKVIQTGKEQFGHIKDSIKGGMPKDKPSSTESDALGYGS